MIRKKGLLEFPRIFVRCEHHGMLRNAINKDEVTIFSGCGDLYFYMGKAGLMNFSFVKQRKLYFSLSAAAQLCGKRPFVMVEQFAFCGQADDIVLFHGIVAFLKRAFARSIAEKVTSLMEVKPFYFEEWISKKILTGRLLLVRTVASAT